VPTPLVSVIVPTHDHERFIGETLDSVFAQSYPNLQVIVSDDASTDGTVDLVRERYDGRVDLVTSAVNTGISGNFNRALAAVRGEYVAWLDGDDLMRPHRIARQVQELQAQPGAAGCVGDAEVLQWPSGEVLGRFTTLVNGRPGVRSGGIELLFDPNYAMLPSVSLLRASAIPKHGFDERIPVLNDWLFHIEVFRRGPVVGIDEVLGSYRRHGGNVTLSPDTLARSIEDQLIVLAIIAARYPELAPRVKRRTAAVHLIAARDALARRRGREAARRISAARLAGGTVGAGMAGAHLAVGMVQRMRARRDVHFA
jgi:glycosyltransferase involved in cell wall biosynthesis